MADSKAKVPAREQLEARDAEPKDNLEQQAKDAEKLQKQELSAGKHGSGEADKLTKAGNVAAARHSGDDNFKVDQFARRNANDAMEGLFCKIDKKDKDVQEAFKAVGLEDSDQDYGVFLSVAESGEDRYPVSINVRLRGDSNALVTVPYEACRVSQAGGR